MDALINIISDMDIVTVIIAIVTAALFLVFLRFSAQVSLWALGVGVLLIILYYVWTFIEEEGILDWFTDHLPF